MPNTSTDYNTVNDQTTQQFAIVGTSTVSPYSENFSSAAFPYANWIIINPDNSTTWARVTTNTGSIKMDFYNYGAVGAKDDAVIPPIDLSATTTASLKFDLAYAYYTDANGSLYDSLNVLVSTDCGATWTSVYYDGGATMSTDGALSTLFTPTAAQWSTKCIDLAPYVGHSQVLIKFEGIDDYGNDLYIDNVAVQNSTCALGVAEQNSINDVNIYPNPSDKTANIGIDLAKTENVTINVYNMTGELVSAMNEGELAEGQHNVVLNGANLADGMYFVTITTGDTRVTRKITIAH